MLVGAEFIISNLKISQFHFFTCGLIMKSEYLQEGLDIIIVIVFYFRECARRLECTPCEREECMLRKRTLSWPLPRSVGFLYLFSSVVLSLFVKGT